ncbi:MAG: vanadium-dependent haloperoxidase [Solirubrobacteraceae bacterium]
MTPALAVCALSWGLTTPATARQTPAPPASPQLALDWNLNAVDAVRASTPAKFPAESVLYMSYVQAAVYDAATKIAGRYVPYHAFSAPARRASLDAAVTAAAYNTLVAYLGDPDGTLAAKYAAGIAALPDRGKDTGIAVGQAAAADLVALRATDGRNAPTAIFGAPGPVVAGQWQVVPPATTAQTPWMAFMRPFMLDSASQFRADPPPDLQSRGYARDLNETKDYGALNSTVRTPAQTATAYFWNASAMSQYNQALRDLATEHGMDAIDTVRLLAMGNMVPADAAIACFDSKYHYLFWRPYTAIRSADLDGNPATTADPNWTPLLNTPNHPEYPSAHGCATGAFAEVLANALHTTHINVDIRGATNGDTALTSMRHFDTVSDLDRQVVDARVWIGFHYRHSVVVGEQIAREVSRWTLKRYFRPVHSDRSDSTNQWEPPRTR